MSKSRKQFECYSLTEKGGAVYTQSRAGREYKSSEVAQKAWHASKFKYVLSQQQQTDREIDQLFWTFRKQYEHSSCLSDRGDHLTADALREAAKLTQKEIVEKITKKAAHV